MPQSKKRKEQKSIHKPFKLLFLDEMRYGLMSNLRRSWSKVGERTLIEQQHEYVNRYLYTAIDPIDGESFHILGWDDVSTRHMHSFLCELKEHFNQYHLLIVWDNAPFHKPKTLTKVPHTTIIPLPSYSPQLNPVERFFGEMRKVTANRIFREGIEVQELLLEEEIKRWIGDKKRVKQLCGYDWIKEQWGRVIGVVR